MNPLDRFFARVGRTRAFRSAAPVTTLGWSSAVIRRTCAPSARAVSGMSVSRAVVSGCRHPMRCGSDGTSCLHEECGYPEPMPDPFPAPSSRPSAAQDHADTVRRGLGADCRKTVWPADHRCVLCDGHAALDALLALLAEAQQEAGLILVALAEPCAECGHVDWRADDARIDSYRNALATAKSERDEAYRQAAQADEANVMMGDRCRDVEIALATAEVLADRRLEALRQASDCCSRPPGVCFDSALARLEKLEAAARHYLDGTDPDGYVNLRALLAAREEEVT